MARVLREVTEETGLDASGFGDEEFVVVWQYLVLPDLLLSFHPGHVFVTWVLPNPVDPNRCTAMVVNLRGTRPEERTSWRAPLPEFDGDRMTPNDLARFGRAVEQVNPDSSRSRMT